MNVKLGFFPYNAEDYKAAQAYLDRKAAVGGGRTGHIFPRRPGLAGGPRAGL